MLFFVPCDRRCGRLVMRASAASGTMGHVSDGADGFRSLDWLRRRRAGESVADIAADCGVRPARVSRATARFGPFPDADRGSADREPRVREWVRLRRSGVRVADIADRFGVPHQTVSRWTNRHGPFGPAPGPDLVADWVRFRRDGVSINSLAARDGVRAERISAATRPFGPYPPPSIRRGKRRRDDVAPAISAAEATSMDLSAGLPSAPTHQRVDEIPHLVHLSHRRPERLDGSPPAGHPNDSE